MVDCVANSFTFQSDDLVEVHMVSKRFDPSHEAIYCKLKNQINEKRFFYFITTISTYPIYFR